MRRRPLAIGALGISLAVLGALAATASGAGGPVPLNLEPVDVGTPDGDTSLIATHEGPRTTVTRLEDGEPQGSVTIRGRFAVSAVAFDSSASGLSADGRTLVLRQVAYPKHDTSFAILDAERLRLREVITLRGVLTFDAISPDGSRLYFIKYPSPRDATRYAVREYDIGSGRLFPDPIVDPRERGEEMRGSPITRTVSPDGRWAYTLYDGGGGGKMPFVHALDTARGRAVCIDHIEPLGRLSGHDVANLQLSVSDDGSELAIAYHGEPPIALVDTRTFRVNEPLPPERAAGRQPAGGDSGVPWSLIVPAAAVLLFASVALILILRHRGDRLAPGDA